MKMHQKLNDILESWKKAGDRTDYGTKEGLPEIAYWRTVNGQNVGFVKEGNKSFAVTGSSFLRNKLNQKSNESKASEHFSRSAKQLFENEASILDKDPNAISAAEYRSIIAQTKADTSGRIDKILSDLGVSREEFDKSVDEYPKKIAEYTQYDFTAIYKKLHTDSIEKIKKLFPDADAARISVLHQQATNALRSGDALFYYDAMSDDDFVTRFNVNLSESERKTIKDALAATLEIMPVAQRVMYELRKSMVKENREKYKVPLLTKKHKRNKLPNSISFRGISFDTDLKSDAKNQNNAQKLKLKAFEDAIAIFAPNFKDTSESGSTHQQLDELRKLFSSNDELALKMADFVVNANTEALAKINKLSTEEKASRFSVAREYAKSIMGDIYDPSVDTFSMSIYPPSKYQSTDNQSFSDYLSMQYRDYESMSNAEKLPVVDGKIDYSNAGDSIKKNSTTYRKFWDNKTGSISYDFVYKTEQELKEGKIKLAKSILDKMIERDVADDDASKNIAETESSVQFGSNRTRKSFYNGFIRSFLNQKGSELSDSDKSKLSDLAGKISKSNLSYVLMRLDKDTSRAAYSPDLCSFTVSSLGAVTHELAHFVEDQNSDLKSASFRYLQPKIAGEDFTSMNALRGASYHGVAEVGCKDRAIEPYITRSYGGREGRVTATEVASVATEAFALSPDATTSYRVNRDLFHHQIALSNGSFVKGK